MKTENKNVRLHTIVEGSVQGVGFRFFVIQKAEELGLTGWVRNLWDGRVEVTAEGQQKNLEQLHQLLKEGPRSANVTKVSMDWSDASDEFMNFDVHPNG